MLRMQLLSHARLLGLLGFRQLDLTASVALYKTGSDSREQLGKLLIKRFCGPILWHLLVLLNVVLSWLRCQTFLNQVHGIQLSLEILD